MEEPDGGGAMSVKGRIAAIRLAEKVERNREYAERIGVFVKVGKGVESGERNVTRKKYDNHERRC